MSTICSAVAAVSVTDMTATQKTDIAKLISMAVKDASVFNIKLLPFVIITGICGAVLGRTLNKKASDKTVNRCFIAVQIVIIVLCIFNIIKYVISIY